MELVSREGWAEKMRLLLLYLVAAIAGALGGCGAGAMLALTSKSAIRAMQVVAYATIGFTCGMFVLAFGYLLGLDTDDPAVLVRWSLLLGMTVPITLFSHNMAISAILRRFGFEIEFTIRRNKEERRGMGFDIRDEDP